MRKKPNEFEYTETSKNGSESLKHRTILDKCYLSRRVNTILPELLKLKGLYI